MNYTDDENVNAFVDAYIDTMWWANAYAENEETGELEPAGFDAYVHGDYADGTEQTLINDALTFVMNNGRNIRRAVDAYDHYSWGMAGHDYALTRNGHGAGFWDRGIGDLGDLLTGAASAYGESGLYPTDHGYVVE